MDKIYKMSLFNLYVNGHRPYIKVIDHHFKTDGGRRQNDQSPWMQLYWIHQNTGSLILRELRDELKLDEKI